MGAVDQQVVEHHLQHFAVSRYRRGAAFDLDVDLFGAFIGFQQPDSCRQQRYHVGGRALWLRRAREEQEIFHHRVEGIDAFDDFLHHRRVRIAGQQTAANHLHRAANAGKRVLHLVRDHRRHLAQLRHGGAVA
jgi:hypothetical protein